MYTTSVNVGTAFVVVILLVIMILLLLVSESVNPTIKVMLIIILSAWIVYVIYSQVVAVSDLVEPGEDIIKCVNVSNEMKPEEKNEMKPQEKNEMKPEEKNETKDAMDK